MDRYLIRHVAEMYGSVVERAHSQNMMLRCPLASTHKGGSSKSSPSPTFSVRVNEHGPSVGHCFVCELAGPLAYCFTQANEMVGGGFEAIVAFCEEHDAGGLAQALEGLRLQRAREAAPSELMAPAALEAYVAKCTRLVPRYIVQRGFSRVEIERYKIGFDGGGPLPLRATFPVWNTERVLIGCSGRTILPDGVDPPKYRDWPPSFARVKTDYFYGEHEVDATLEEGVLVEGQTSKIVASRVFPNVLGMWGASTGISPARLMKLVRWFKKLTLIFDGDPAGVKAVYGRIDEWNRYHPGLRENLRRHFVVRVATLPSGEDPASITSDTLVRAHKEAKYLLLGR